MKKKTESEEIFPTEQVKAMKDMVNAVDMVAQKIGLPPLAKPNSPEIPDSSNPEKYREVERSTETPATHGGEVNKLPAAAFRASFTRDFKAVNEQDRARYVHAMCKVLDISAVLNPFYFLDMNGKTLLYAGIEAAQLLAESKKLNVEVRRKSLDEKTRIYTVEVRVTGPTGRFCDNEGVIFLGGLSGKDLANAQMKAITKAQRRSILSYCGLSMTDEADIQGDYGAPHNPLAERTAQIVAAAPQAESLFASMVGDDETKKARSDLFKAMLTGTNPPFKDPKEAGQWVQLKTDGKRLHELTPDECERLMFDLQDEQSDAVEAREPGEEGKP